MTKIKRPFAFGLGTLYDGFSRVNSIGALKYIIMALGLYSALLSSELTILGFSQNKLSALLPGHETRQEKAFEKKRYVPKGVDDGAKLSRINPLLPINHILASRTDAIALYGLTGVFGDASEDAALDHIREEFEGEKDFDPEYYYEQQVSNWFSKVLRTWDVPQDSYWNKENALNSAFNLGVWIFMGCVQSWIWRGASRSFLGDQFTKANKVRKKSASKDAIQSAKIYEVAHNWVDSLKALMFACMFIGSYVVEFSLNSSALSAKVSAQLFFKILAVFGFEGSYFLITELRKGTQEEVPEPKPQPNHDKPKPKGVK